MPHKVFFRGFWPGFSPYTAVGQFFLAILNNIYMSEGGVKTTNSIGEADILFDSCFDGTAIPWKRWKATYFYSGESYALPNWKNYDIALWGERVTTSPNIVTLPLFPLYLLDLGEPPLPLLPEQVRPIPEKDVLVMISNPGGEVRRHFLEALEESDLKITYAGKYKNNIGGAFQPAFGTPEFAAFASQFKFIITMENSQQENYITEKILQGLFAENVPVYYGSPRICEYFNKDRFINHTGNAAETIAEMRRLRDNPDQWLETVRQPWRGPLAHTLTPTCLAEQCMAVLSRKAR